MKMRLTEEVWKEGNMYVSYCPELDISSCGEDVRQEKNLLEVITINIEGTKKLGAFEQFIQSYKTPSSGRGQSHLAMPGKCF